MMSKDIHSFYIPVMGTSFTIDSPIKVAKYGISSVISIMDDYLCEKMREFHARNYNLEYIPIPKSEEDYRAKRITSYLNLMDIIVKKQILEIKKMSFEQQNDLTKYFELLKEEHDLKQQYLKMLKTTDSVERKKLRDFLKTRIKAGSIDVNIMTKVDRDNFDAEGNKLPDGFSDALSALRGFARSTVKGSVIFSAGFNWRLYAYAEQFSDFFPDQLGNLKKKVVLKVSDFRSANIQGNFFAKRGIWVSEHRIESGLNCGGHVFATNGSLLGPVMEEFKEKRTVLAADLFKACNKALAEKGLPQFSTMPEMRITVQGGIGTAKEDEFLFDYYKVDATGWGSPFLLVKEVSTVDDETRQLLINAKKEDYFLSRMSPIGIPFNSVRGTRSEEYRLKRVKEGHPGYVCPKGHLALFNTEFSEKPLCLADVRYKRKKIEQLKTMDISLGKYQELYDDVIEKTCLCEDLGVSAYLQNNIPYGFNRPLNSLICPGPNLAYFERLMSLSEMAGHIYGRINVLRNMKRPNMFINELKIYFDFLRYEIKKALPKPTAKQIEFLNKIKKSLWDGIEYYKTLIPKIVNESERYREIMKQDLNEVLEELINIINGNNLIFAPASSLKP